MSTFSTLKLDKIDIVILLPFHNIQLQPFYKVNERFYWTDNSSSTEHFMSEDRYNFIWSKTETIMHWQISKGYKCFIIDVFIMTWLYCKIKLKTNEQMNFYICTINDDTTIQLYIHGVGSRGHDGIVYVVGFNTTYTISAYHQ